MSDALPPAQRATPSLGILGGGQLGRMLAEAALAQGMRPVVLAASRAVPAAIPGVLVVEGRLDDPAALDALLDRVDHLTIENEFLDLDRLGAALARHPAVDLHPGLEAIAVSQDKLAQKRLFARLGIATAEHLVIRPGAEAADLALAAERFAGGSVLKWSRFGYDGRGNLVFGEATDPQAVRAFCDAGRAKGAEIYAERLVAFEDELAMVATRFASGDETFFPLVISRQEAGVCREVVGPATDFGVPAAVAHRARDVLRAIGTDLDWRGSFAVEFFLDEDGGLLANEMAPRVHNTGHYTLFAEEPSQFELHVRAVTGGAARAPAVEGLAVMYNLLGPWDVAPHTPCPPPEAPPPPGTLLYWYEKRTVSPGRKMGHLTGRAGSVGAIRDLLDAMRAYEARFWAATKGR